MEITRRDFLKYLGASAVALGLGRMPLSQIEAAMAAASDPAVVWLSGASCSGCSVSLLNAVNPTIDQVLLDTVSLKYHNTLMASAGEMAVTAARSSATAGGHILVVEGAVPAGEGGQYCFVWEEDGHPVTMVEAVQGLATNASHIVAVGTCSAFGGIPAAFCGTDVQTLGDFLGRSVVNLPGCPAHPDWIIGTLASLIGGVVPDLDSYGRPLDYYPSQVIHSRCPRRESEEASSFGQANRCLEELGCRGKHSHADCDWRGWNNGENWCIGANGLCIGCTEPSFPAFPLHGEVDDDDHYVGDAAGCVAASPPTAIDDPSPSKVHLPFVSKPN